MSKTTTKTIMMAAALAWTGTAGTAVADDSKALDVSVVAPGILSTADNEFSATLSPDGQSLYYGISNLRWTHTTLMVAKKEGSKWGKPSVASFSGEWNDTDPSFSPDGKRIYYWSNRSIGSEYTGTYSIWYVEKDLDGNWSDPINFEGDDDFEGHTSHASQASDGSVYFAHNRAIYVTRLKDGKYQKAEKLNLVNSGPSIAPDQSFMILTKRAGAKSKKKIAISYPLEGNKWTEPELLPEPINSKFNETSPFISADGKTLFFASNRLDISNLEWPRKKRHENEADVLKELQGQWQNGHNNIYKVNIEHILKSK